MFFLTRNVKKPPKCTNTKSNSLHRRGIYCTGVTQHQHLYSHCLNSHTPCTGRPIHSKTSTLHCYTKQQLPDSVCFRRDPGPQKACLHGKIKKTTKIYFRMPTISSQALNFIIISISYHCQYEYEVDKHLSMHTEQFNN